MSDQPKEDLQARPRRLVGLPRLRSDLRRTAQLQDHLHRMAARLHLWIAFHALLAVASVIALAWYFAQGQCCR
jgi:hypothetical protein